MNAVRPNLLWGAIAALAFVLMLEWAWPSGGGDAPVPVLHLASVRAAGQPAAIRQTQAWSAAILQRPLFSISRRPPRAVHGGGAVTAAGQSRLSGIMITRTSRRAIFAPEGGGKALVLAEGASVNESTIRRIQPDSVVLASGSVLKPAFDRNRSPATTPAYQPPAGNFLTPGFPGAPYNPAFPNANFPVPGFPNQGQPAQGIVAPQNLPGEDVNNLPQPPPSPRNQFTPRRE